MSKKGNQFSLCYINFYRDETTQIGMHRDREEENALHPLVMLTLGGCLWFLVAATISIVGGWFSLSKLYRTRVPFNETKWRMQSGQMRWLANYNKVLTLGASPQGLYLASVFLCRLPCASDE
jgi:hypothetical protein